MYAPNLHSNYGPAKQNAPLLLLRNLSATASTNLYKHVYHMHNEYNIMIKSFLHSRCMLLKIFLQALFLKFQRLSNNK